jgi:hypothetical protein
MLKFFSGENLGRTQWGVSNGELQGQYQYIPERREPSSKVSIRE